MEGMRLPGTKIDGVLLRPSPFLSLLPTGLSGLRGVQLGGTKHKIFAPIAFDGFIPGVCFTLNQQGKW